MNRQTKRSKEFDFKALENQLQKATKKDELFDVIVNAPFEYELACANLRLGIMVLLLLNSQVGMIERIALTKNYLAENTKRVSAKKFEAIKIPIGHKYNIIAQAIETGEPQQTSDWKYLFVPALSPSEARMNQASGGIGTSVVYPLTDIQNKAALIFSYYQYPENLSQLQYTFMNTYVRLVNKTLRA